MSHLTSGGVRSLRVLVIGAGVAGLVAAIELRRSDTGDVTVVEKAERPGGHLAGEHLPGHRL